MATGGVTGAAEEEERGRSVPLGTARYRGSWGTGAAWASSAPGCPWEGVTELRQWGAGVSGGADSGTRSRLGGGEGGPGTESHVGSPCQSSR